MAGKTLASKTGQVRFNVPGATGPIGPLVYPAGEYDAATKYIRTSLSAPMVLDDGQYYVLNKEGAFIGIRPKDDYAANGSKATWVLMEYVKYAFVEVLMANFAKLASAVFYGDVMMSQQGIDADGNESSSYQNYGKKRYDPSTGKSADLFTPNILFNFLTGYASMNNIMVRGTTINPFVGVNDATFPSPTGKGSNIICTVGKNTMSKILLMESVEYTTKQMNGLRFFVLVRIAASSTGYDGDRFQLSFWGKADGDNTWPTCFVIPGVTTKGRTIGVKKSTILDLMFIPKVYNEDGLIHRIADIHVFNYDSSYMTVTDWDDSNFSTLPSESDFVEL